MYNPFSLLGKSILITGASSGIGRAIAIECSKMGANVYILGRDKKRLMETFLMLNSNEKNKYYSIDLTDEVLVSNFVNELEEFDGVVNAAGILKRLPIKFLNVKDLNEILNINFTAPTMLLKNLISKNKINKGGSIVFISSISGCYCTSIGNSMYSASKGALNAIAKNMALELANKKIRVNSIHPGMVSTNMHNNNTYSTEELTNDVENYPLKRYGNPEDIAYATIYLLSNASSWVTGSNLLLDGGFTLK